ncbi:hypothetical protein G3M48_006770 [Beauveria asiatica]|uniref:Maltose/galactoside acetyltransferase domain-containing protein n=1 Tax=Beauveria asiatica TaxID=1069075 RepID=A0AAW0RNY4_9HYPO
MSASSADGKPIDQQDNLRRMAAGELYYAFTPDLIAARKRVETAYQRFNKAEDASRRELAEMWNDITQDKTPLPARAASEEQDEELLQDLAWVDRPIGKIDYGYNIKLGKNVYINSNSVWIDTCTITIGDRVMAGPNVSFYSGTHPVDYRIRNGTRGPESGAPITVGDDCWIGGNVTILAGVTIGRGSVIGAASVVTKDIPAESVAVGSPARVIKKVDTSKPPQYQ